MRIGPDPFAGALARTQALQTRIAPANEENKPNTFGELLRIAMTGSSETHQALSAASRLETAKVLTGQEDNLIDNMVAGEKSSIQFELNLTIRSKMIDAYNEIMRTQV